MDTKTANYNDRVNYLKNLELLKEGNEFEDISLSEKSWGTSLTLKSNLSNYLNNENADMEIANWFKNSFEKFAKFMNETPEMQWQLKPVFNKEPVNQ